MPTPKNPRHEHSHTYFVQDQSNRTSREELARLQVQGQMLTTGMGGVLPEQPEGMRFQRILDVGCGTGDWLIEVANTFSNISLLMGMDINKKMVDYAQSQAEALHLSDRVQFRIMDALRQFDFAPGFFDPVNMRLGQSYIRTWEWAALLAECQRVSRPGGVIRITEAETVSQSSSSAVTRLGSIFTQALHRAGHYFTPSAHGITSHLARLLDTAGLQQVQTRTYTLECRAGTVEGKRFAEDVKHLFRTGLPFFQKWTRLPDDYEEIYQQALFDMQQPDFVAIWNLLTVWGSKPEAKKPS